ncbi:MAG: TIGR03862 family flavoprotein [Pseudomarimonas sp.]
MQESISHRAIVIGGGPAGLMAAEALRSQRIEVDLFDSKGSVGRKFLIAGKGGLNLTHSEPFERFVSRFGARSQNVEDWLRDFDPEALRQWARELGVATFVGSSGRVFPSDLKAAPLLRGWLRRLRASGVRLHVQHRCTGWSDDGALRFETAEGESLQRADAVVLALGGGSWAKLGSDGLWVDWLGRQGIEIAPLLPANCGFEARWSALLIERYAGQPLKPVRVSFVDHAGKAHSQRGELIVTAHGLEGSLMYALSAPLRETIAARGTVVIEFDLDPERSLDTLTQALSKPRGKHSMSEHLRRCGGIDGVRAALLHESAGRVLPTDPGGLARLIKRVVVTLHATRPLDEAISSAGGVRFEALDRALMVTAMPGVFCCGEMLDWEAPTGGYLLTASMASGRIAGLGAAAWLRAKMIA